MKQALAALALFPAVWLPAQTTHLTLDDLLDGPTARTGARELSEGLASPDGKHLAAIKGGQIVLKRPGEDAVRAVTSSPGPKSELQWSSDSKYLAFISEGQVWSVAAEEREARQLTHDPAGPGDPRGATDHVPQWNPNGRWILYESGQKGFNELYVVSADGAEDNLLASTEIYHGADVIAKQAPDHGDAVSSDRFAPRPAWSPDGTRISFTERSREFFSGKLKVLPFDQKTGKAAGPGVDIYVAKNDIGGAWAVNSDVWSPDGTTLATVLQDSGWDKIWLIPAKGGKPREITFGEGEDENPIYSPDGQWIAFESNRGLPEARHIWLVPAKGGESRRLTSLQGNESGIRWSADSKSIRFVDTSILGASSTYIADVAAGSAPKQIGETRHSKFEQLGITPEVVRYQSTDGLTIAGILYKPAAYKAGTRYAAVILAHGGPEGQTALSAAPWSLYLAQHGYIVLEPNFRGSTGYGERFRNSNVEDSGGGEIDDIAASAKYLVDAGLADASRIGISGGSHGGTVVANAVTKLPDTFAVGIEKYGVVDRALFLRYTNRNSAIRWETKMGGPPDKKPAVYRKANILPDVSRIKTPLLILHGEQDPQVPPQESQQFVAALKQAGKVYEYKTYPNEGHGFQQRDHRKDAYERELEYLDRYLKPSETR